MASFHVYRRLLNHKSPLTTEENNNSNFLNLHYTEFDDKNFQIHDQTLFYLLILLAILLLLTLILLYARWYFRFRDVYPTSSQVTHYDNSHAPHAPSVGVKGLDMEVINAIPIILHQGSGIEREDEMECCICLGVFEDGDKVKVLTECDHRFHSDCVDRWLSGQPTCPLCRVSLKPVVSKPGLECTEV